MRWVAIAGVLGALLPTLAWAQVKVMLGDGVSVIFPGAPAKLHMTSEPPPGPPATAGMGFLKAIGSTDMWMLRSGGATFQATVMTPREAPAAAAARCGGPPLPVPPGSLSPCDSVGQALTSPPESRHMTEAGALFASRSVQLNGRVYGVIFIRPGESQLAKLDPRHETPPASAGEAFLNSFKVAPAPAN